MSALCCVLLIEISLYKLNTWKKSANFVRTLLQENISKETEKCELKFYVENNFSTREAYLEPSPNTKRERFV